MYLINFDNSQDYDTLNGYIIGQIGRITKNQEEIIIANHKFKILNIKDNFIGRLFFASWKNNLYIRNPKNQNMTLNDIRKSGLLIIVIGVAMLGFILTDLMNSGSSSFKRTNTLLKVDDKIMFTNFEMESRKI